MKINLAIGLSVLLTITSSNFAAARTCFDEGINPQNKIKGPSYILPGQSNIFWLEGDANLLSSSNIDHTVLFSTAEGYQTSESFSFYSWDIVARASLTHSYPGENFVLTRPDRPVSESNYPSRVQDCKNIVVQNAPTITASYSDERYPARATFSYTIDQNSKAYKEGRPVTFKLIYSGTVRLSRELPSNQLSGSFTVEKPPVPRGNSGVGVIDDGTYTASDSFHIPTVMPADCAIVCPESLGMYLSQCQGTSSACNYTIW